jgi:hypothetical protein
MNITEAIRALIACVGEERFREELEKIRAGKPGCDDRTEERELIRQVLREMGIREGTHGLSALTIGVELTLEYDMAIECKVMKEIIPEVARQMGKSVAAAEKNIRWGIEGAWNRMTPPERVRWFGHAGVKPRIGGFLVTAATEVRRRTVPEIRA